MPAVVPGAALLLESTLDGAPVVLAEPFRMPTVIPEPFLFQELMEQTSLLQPASLELSFCTALEHYRSCHGCFRATPQRPRQIAEV